jgi:hypothetical protein
VKSRGVEWETRNEYRIMRRCLAKCRLRKLRITREDNIKTDLMEIDCEDQKVDGVGSGSCKMIDFGIGGGEPSGSTATVLIN